MSTIKKKNNIWYFDDYFESLRKRENEIATSIRQFVLDPKRYLFNTKETLHDAVLTESDNSSIFIKAERSIRICFYLCRRSEGNYKIQAA